MLCIKHAFSPHIHVYCYNQITLSKLFNIHTTSFRAIGYKLNEWKRWEKQAKSYKTATNMRESVYQEKAPGITRTVYSKESSEVPTSWSLTTTYWMHTMQAIGFSQFIPSFAIHTHLWIHTELHNTLNIRQQVFTYERHFRGARKVCLVFFLTPLANIRPIEEYF